MKKRFLLAALLCATALLLCTCKKAPDEGQLYQKLFSALESAGYSCTLEELSPDTPVGIYNASVWKALRLSGGESVQVYFDESNRADYLVTMVDSSAFGCVTHFGQRFVLVYSGTDEAVLQALKNL